MTKLDWLADAIRDEGGDVREHDGWKTRTMRPFSEYSPVGILDHHTAGSSILTNYPDPPYWPDDRLESACNVTIRPDGLIVVLNAGWAFDSGYGDRHVLAAVRADELAPAPTDTYNASGSPAGSNPGIGGNRWFIDIEVQHRGDGGPIDPRQRAALILTNAAICRHEGWNPATRVIGHRGWTRRKIDPRWNGTADPMPQIRLDTIRQLEGDDDMTPAQEAKLDEALQLLHSLPGKTWLHPQKEDPAVTSAFQYQIRTYAGVLQLLGRDDLNEEEVAAFILETLTPEKIAQAALAAGVGQAVIDAIVAELTD